MTLTRCANSQIGYKPQGTEIQQRQHEDDNNFEATATTLGVSAWMYFLIVLLNHRPSAAKEIRQLPVSVYKDVIICLRAAYTMV